MTNEKTINAISAPAVIIKTDHIRTYLEQHDPKALEQANAALNAFTEEEYRTVAEYRKVREAGPSWTEDDDEGEEIL
jgi:hypothetical protein